MDPTDRTRTPHDRPDEPAGDPRVGPAARVLILLVRAYQLTLSHLIGGHCRFRPTCSNYALDALRSHGAGRGSWLAVRRIVRCHPWGGCGYDPVPDPASPPGASRVSANKT